MSSPQSYPLISRFVFLLWFAQSHDCRACFDCASPQCSALVLQTFLKVLEAIDKSLAKLAELELSCNVEQFFKGLQTCGLLDEALLEDT